MSSVLSRRTWGLSGAVLVSSALAVGAIAPVSAAVDQPRFVMRAAADGLPVGLSNGDFSSPKVASGYGGAATDWRGAGETYSPEMAQRADGKQATDLNGGSPNTMTQELSSVKKGEKVFVTWEDSPNTWSGCTPAQTVDAGQPYQMGFGEKLRDYTTKRAPEAKKSNWQKRQLVLTADQDAPTLTFKSLETRASAACGPMLAVVTASYEPASLWLDNRSDVAHAKKNSDGKPGQRWRYPSVAVFNEGGPATPQKVTVTAPAEMTFSRSTLTMWRDGEKDAGGGEHTISCERSEDKKKLTCDDVDLGVNQPPRWSVLYPEMAINSNATPGKKVAVKFTVGDPVIESENAPVNIL